MTDMAALAELSHALERAALTLCHDDEDDSRIECCLVGMADGEQEAVAVALSYALRRRELGRRESGGPDHAVDRAVSALTGALRRMVAGAQRR